LKRFYSDPELKTVQKLLSEVKATTEIQLGLKNNTKLEIKFYFSGFCVTEKTKRPLPIEKKIVEVVKEEAVVLSTSNTSKSKVYEYNDDSQDQLNEVIKESIETAKMNAEEAEFQKAIALSLKEEEDRIKLVIYFFCFS
jgi:hypothetical protein